MSYQQFAYLYDELMKDIDYNQWISFVKESLPGELTSKSKLRVLDLACGTGELSVRLADEGYEVTGVDLSEEMLAVAGEKAMEKGKQITLFQQNMMELEGHEKFDVILCFCDSLNYLGSSDEVRQTFQCIFNQLVDGGLFLFDVHSIYKMNQIFADQTFVSNADDISYIWNCYQGEFENSVEHDLSFFVKKENGNEYVRYDEVHFQRTFEPADYQKWLEAVGFTLNNISSDFQRSITDQPERIFFSLKK
ncbi:class I SAM-dependent methyltransferase [Cytobacillus suaedae]|nr:class I SAM-dependent methyltransferase [Cytobacillus suaedae]